MKMKKKQHDKEIEADKMGTKDLLIDWLDEQIEKIKACNVFMSDKSDSIFHNTILSATMYKKNMLEIIDNPNIEYIKGIYNSIYNTETGESILDTIMCNYSKSNHYGTNKYDDSLYIKFHQCYNITNNVSVGTSWDIEFVENIKRYINDNYFKLEELSTYGGYDEEYDEDLNEAFKTDVLGILNSDIIDNRRKLFVILRLLILIDLMGDNVILDYNNFDVLRLDSESLYDISVIYIDSLNNDNELYRAMTKLATITLFGITDNISNELPMMQYNHSVSLYNNDTSQYIQSKLIRNMVFYTTFYMTGILVLKDNPQINTIYNFNMLQNSDIIKRLINNIENTFYMTLNDHKSFVCDEYLSNNSYHHKTTSYMTYILSCTLSNIDSTGMIYNMDKISTIGNVILPIIHNIEFNGCTIPKLFYNNFGVQYIFNMLLVDTNYNHLDNPLNLDDMILDYLCTNSCDSNNVFHIKSLSRLISSKIIVNMLSTIDPTVNDNTDLLGYGILSNSVSELCKNILDLCDIECILHVIEIIMDKYKNKVNLGLYRECNINLDPFKANELYIICKSKEVFKHTLTKFI